MKFESSIKKRITRILLLFTLLLTSIYSFLLLGYSWVVEDNVFNRLVDQEAKYLLETYRVSGQLNQPRVPYMRLFESWHQAPPEVYQQHLSDPDRIEFTTSSGATFHVKELKLGQHTAVLAADVSAYEVSKDYLPTISLWLLLALVGVALIALKLSLVVANSALHPLARLADKVALSQQQKLSAGFSDDFPKNEIGYLAQAFEKSIVQLQSALQREVDFTRDVSHELRTPATVLKNLSQQLQGNGQLDVKSVGLFSQAVNQLEQTVTTLLALAREESVHSEHLSLLSVLEDCVVNHYELVNAEHFVLNIKVAPDFKVAANKNLLVILINNLLSNALHHASDKGLTVRTEGCNVIFENYTNSAITPDPFALHVKGESSSGLGLGLNLVQRICQSQGWHCECDSYEDLFRITLYTSVASVSSNPPS